MEEKETKERDEEMECSQPGKEAPEGGTSGPSKDPVNVDTPGWKSSQGDQGSGAIGTEGEETLGVLDVEEKTGEKPLKEEDVPGTGTGVGGEVAPVGDQVHGHAGTVEGEEKN